MMIVAVFCGCEKKIFSKDYSESTHLTIIEGEQGKLENENDLLKNIMSEMTVREKVGQLFFVRPDAVDPDITPEEIADSSSDGSKMITDKMAEMYREYPAGGFVIFGKNISDPEQLKELIVGLHDLNSVRPLICVDEEGGWVARIANSGVFEVPVFPNMQTIADSGDVSSAYELGKTIGGYLKELGFDVDFAPVADVNTNPDNPIIGERAFGNDPQLAGRMVARVLDGLHSQGIMGCIKHFPGHGDTVTDTHTGYAETLKDWNEIRNCELIPFCDGIDADTDMIMAAHIAVPNVTGTSEPSSMSYEMLTEKLRGEIGYDGLIITDALAMEAIHEKYNSAEAAVKAFTAGADILLMPYDYPEAFEGVLGAVESGEITEDRLDESVYRILSAKYGK